MKELKESLRKLEPIIGKKAKGLWYLNLFGQDKTKRETSISTRTTCNGKRKLIDIGKIVDKKLSTYYNFICWL